jgi:excisionase family DNA binding protein
MICIGLEEAFKVDEILTFEEAKRYLKFSRTKLYHLVQQGKIPASKIGRNWRFKKVKIDEWLDKHSRGK